jgi:hypothetical protein
VFHPRNAKTREEQTWEIQKTSDGLRIRFITPKLNETTAVPRSRRCIDCARFADRPIMHHAWKVQGPERCEMDWRHPFAEYSADMRTQTSKVWKSVACPASLRLPL